MKKQIDSDVVNQSKIRKPNLFLVGGSRCGTGSWHYWLKQHPDIFMSEEMMPNFFGEWEDANKRHYNTEEKYLSLFKEAKNEKYLGEISHLFHYLNAPKQIKKFNPNSKIIVILRSPIDSFRSNIDAGNDNFPVRTMVFRFRELMYYENLKRWIDTFGRKNVHIMLYEDHVKDTETEYKKVCDFLRIDNTFKPEFKIINPSAKSNYPPFMKIIFFIWNKLTTFKVRLKIKELVGGNRMKIKKFYRKLDNGKEVKSFISDYDKKIIQRTFFLKEIEKTEKLINRNLDVWKY